MDFRDLSYVLAIAKYQNITKAANALYITQPTLSKFLQSLEDQLGQKLFRKLGHRFILTYAGERYVAKAKEILELKKQLDQEMNDIIKNNNGALKIAFPAMRGTYMLPCTLPIFNQMYPNIKLDVLEECSSKLEEMLLNGETDLAFFNLPVKSTNIDYEVIKHEEILVIMSVNHPLAHSGITLDNCKFPWMDLHLLKDEPFIMQVPGQRTRDTVDQLCKKMDFTPVIKLETCNIPAAVQLAAKGYGCFFITETHLSHINQTEPIVCFSVGDPCTMVDFVAGFRKNSYLPYHAREYITVVRNFI